MDSDQRLPRSRSEAYIRRGSSGLIVGHNPVPTRKEWIESFSQALEVKQQSRQISAWNTHAPPRSRPRSPFLRKGLEQDKRGQLLVDATPGDGTFRPLGRYNDRITRPRSAMVTRNQRQGASPNVRKRPGSSSANLSVIQGVKMVGVSPENQKKTQNGIPGEPTTSVEGTHMHVEL